jgi:hypothetical protein
VPLSSYMCSPRVPVIEWGPYTHVRWTNGVRGGKRIHGPTTPASHAFFALAPPPDNQARRLGMAAPAYVVAEQHVGSDSRWLQHDQQIDGGTSTAIGSHHVDRSFLVVMGSIVGLLLWPAELFYNLKNHYHSPLTTRSGGDNGLLSAKVQNQWC